jgi:hypothetical protein
MQWTVVESVGENRYRRRALKAQLGSLRRLVGVLPYEACLMYWSGMEVKLRSV